MVVRTYLGIAEGHSDPAAAVVRDGQILAYAEEERFSRVKHAEGAYPIQAIKYCLDYIDIEPKDVDALCVSWDLDAYTKGNMSAFYDTLNCRLPVDGATKNWQASTLSRYNLDNQRVRHQRAWQRYFGSVQLPELRFGPHHRVHAFQAAYQSGFDNAIVLTLDGSGESHCSTIWQWQSPRLEELRAYEIPDSLGWFYAAITEYLGFDAYDGEYKVMGLASYGEHDATIANALARVLQVSEGGYAIDPSFIHYGAHTYSGRFTDHLVELLGREPRGKIEPLTEWHKSVAYHAQILLERAVIQLVKQATRETGISNICLGGGVAHNVKVNSRLFELPEVDDIYVQPLCHDGGSAAGAALYVCFEDEAPAPARLDSVALGPGLPATNILRDQLDDLSLGYQEPDDLIGFVADALHAGKLVGWVNGRMEGGARALGHRSILANPCLSGVRDRVNAAVKYREIWRPFCPSMIEESAGRYLKSHTDAPFMMIAFQATEQLCKEAPEIVHVDGTTRVQLVRKDIEPRYHSLIKAFGERSGTPVLLNTSFNLKGEPVVCTALDAIKTFHASALDLLVLDNLVVMKTGRGDDEQ